MESKKNKIIGKNIVCLINPLAANERWKRRKRLRAELIRQLPGSCLDTPRTKDETVEMTKSVCTQAEVIIAVGGDGTIADVLQGIFEAQKNEQITFGIVPFGSGNAFRESLGLPRNPFKAVKYLLNGDLLTIDLIQVEGRIAGFASIGSTAAVTGEKLSHSIPGLIGHLLAARKLIFYRRHTKILELYDGIDEKGQNFNYLQLTSNFLDCVIGKTNYFGYSWLVAPQARLDDGYLDVVLFEMPPIIYILLFPLIYFGLLQKKLRHFKAREVIIRGDNLDVQYNGEYFGAKHSVRIKILPQALKVIGRRKKAARFMVQKEGQPENPDF
jgi:diacylglycerol kinase (ATP)